MMGKRIIATLLMACAGLASMAQGYDNYRENGRPLPLAGTTDGLYCYVKGLAIGVKEKGGELASAVPTYVGGMEKTKFAYVVNDPLTENLYYTKGNLFGQSQLKVMERGVKKSSGVKINGYGGAVEHPTFTADGQYMVFAAKGGHGHGGRDLYIAERVANGWSQPMNLGDEINTRGDEFAPLFWHDFLIFASNGRNGSMGRADFYAVKLKREGATEGSPAVVKAGEVQNLPKPFNTTDDEQALAVGADKTYLVRSGDSLSMGGVLHSYAATPDMVKLKGVVMDKNRHPQARVVVSVKPREGKAFEMRTDIDGKYEVYLLKDRYYDLTFSKVSYGNNYYSHYAERVNEDNLICEVEHDVTLYAFNPGDYLELQSMFGDDASIELTKEGRAALEPIVSFLKGNPSVPIQMTMYCGLTNDKEFNKVVADSRAKEVQKYLQKKVPEARSVRVSSGGALVQKNIVVKVNDLLQVKFGVF